MTFPSPAIRAATRKGQRADFCPRCGTAVCWCFHPAPTPLKSPPPPLSADTYDLLAGMERQPIGSPVTDWEFERLAREKQRVAPHDALERALAHQRAWHYGEHGRLPDSNCRRCLKPVVWRRLRGATVDEYICECGWTILHRERVTGMENHVRVPLEVKLHDSDWVEP